MAMEIYLNNANGPSNHHTMFATIAYDNINIMINYHSIIAYNNYYNIPYSAINTDMPNEQCMTQKREACTVKLNVQ